MDDDGSSENGNEERRSLFLDANEDDDLSDDISAAIHFGGSKESDVDRIQRPEEPSKDSAALQDELRFLPTSGLADADAFTQRSGQTFSLSEMLFEKEDGKRLDFAEEVENRSLSSDGSLDISNFPDEPNRQEYKTSPRVYESKLSPPRYEPKQIEVSDEIKKLFQLIDAYKPPEVELRTVLKPFIPDFIPAVGGVDEFIKIPRPDGKPDYLGLKVLDEPGPKQSDPAVLNLQLRASSMHSSLHPLQVASLENADKNPKKLDAWIASIKDLHRSRPPPSVVYSKPMPSIEKLMQEW